MSVFLKQMSRVDRAVLFMFCLVPFGILSSGIIHQGHKYSWLICGCIIAGSMLENRWLRYMVWYSCVWQIVICFGWMSAMIPPSQAQGSFKYLFFVVVFSVIVTACTKSKLSLNVFYNFLCVTALIQVVLGIFQLFGYDPILNGLRTLYHGIVVDNIPNVWMMGYQYKSMTGTMANNNFLSVYLAMCLPLFFRPKWIYFVPLISAMILALLTSTATFAIGAACVYYFWDKIKVSRKSWLLIFFVICFLLVTKQSLTIHLLDTISNNQYDRFVWVQEVWKLSTANWDLFLFGYGQGAPWGHVFPIHNEYLECLHHFGLIGLILLFLYVATLYRGNRRLFSVVIVLGFSCLGTYPLHLAIHTYLAAIIFGLIERERQKQCQSVREPAQSVGN